MIITATLESSSADGPELLVTLRLSGNPELAQKTAEQLPDLVPLVSALADGQTDLSELLEILFQLPTLRRLLRGLP